MVPRLLSVEAMSTYSLLSSGIHYVQDMIVSENMKVSAGGARNTCQ